MSRTYTGPLRADKETWTRHGTNGELLWEKRDNGKWYNVETGQEAEVEELTWEELMKRMTDEI
jgi:hypothetical protein